MNTETGIDDGPTQYRRELDDVQLIAFDASIRARTNALLSQGVPLPMDQMAAHHMIGLLECLAGPDDSLRVREWHLGWLDRILDETEAAVRSHLIESGVFDWADK